MSRGLTAQEHLELGSTLKEARRLLLEAAAQSRYYRKHLPPAIRDRRRIDGTEG
jgi:hypothetical protein